MSIRTLSTLPTLKFTATAIRERRVAERIAAGGIGMGELFELMSERFNRIADSARCFPVITAPKTIYTPELDLPPRKGNDVHEEKEWTSPSGVEWRACPVDGCMWGQLTASGKRRQKHSDGEDHSFDQMLDDMPTVEATSDDEGVVEIESEETHELSVEDFRSAIDTQATGFEVESDPEDEQAVDEDVDEHAEALVAEGSGSWGDDD